jgi:hypothetical protein
MLRVTSLPNLELNEVTTSLSAFLLLGKTNAKFVVSRGRG